MKRLKKITLLTIAGANIASAIILLLVGYSDRLDPTVFPLLSIVGLSYPVFLLLNFLFLLFWLFFKKRYALIPFMGFLFAFQPTRNYIPINILHTPPEGSLKVVSFNVWMFLGWNAENKNPTLDYIARQRADILCLQEAEVDGGRDKEVQAFMNKLYMYNDTSQRVGGGDVLAVYSRFPIIRHERIAYPSFSNHSAAFYLKIGGDTVIVINNHLESIRLTRSDKQGFHDIVKGRADAETAEAETKRLADKLAEASKKRAPQARAVARFVEKNKGKSIILCGDFNDSPISYARRTVARRLKDCYVACGNGAGISYHHNGFYVRIDNIMCSDDFTPYVCKVDKSVNSSDHYPIYCILKKDTKR